MTSKDMIPFWVFFETSKAFTFTNQADISNPVFQYLNFLSSYLSIYPLTIQFSSSSLPHVPVLTGLLVGGLTRQASKPAGELASKPE